MAELAKAVLRKKEGRGIFLTILLVVLGLFTLFLISSTVSSEDFKNYDSTTQTLTVVIELLLLAAFFGLWKWSKIGVYAAILLFVVWLLEFYMYELPVYLHTPQANGMTIILLIFQELVIYLLLSLTYFLAIKRKWHLFS